MLLSRLLTLVGVVAIVLGVPFWLLVDFPSSCVTLVLCGWNLLLVGCLLVEGFALKLFWIGNVWVCAL